MSRATVLFAHTAVRRIIRMSISGVTARISVITHARPSPTAATSRPTTAAESQPQSGASLNATSSTTNHADSSAAGSQLIRPGLRTGDSGTNSTAQTAASTARPSGNQNNQW
jgi:hypothetical protein